MSNDAASEPNHAAGAKVRPVDLPPIDQLAQQAGIQLAYTDALGKSHMVAPITLVHVLTSLGVISPEEHKLYPPQSSGWLEPVMVVRQSHRPYPLQFKFPVDQSLPDHMTWTLVTEDGQQHQGTWSHDQIQHSRHQLDEQMVQVTLNLDADGDQGLPWGYHHLTVQADARQGHMRLILVPDKCYVPQSLDHHRIWGPVVQVYSMRSRRNWGMGDFTDLKNLMQWCVEHGAGMLGVNPMHALFPSRPGDASPYSPSSQLFHCIWYIDVEAVPEFAESSEAQAIVSGDDYRMRIDYMRASNYVDYEGVAGLKKPILELCYQQFQGHHLPQHTERAQAFHRFCDTHGEPLRQHATYDALLEHFAQQDASLWGWPVWPQGFQNPNSPEVQSFVQAHQDRVRFYQYCQWLAEEQLEVTQRMAEAAGMPGGLYMDLPVGVDRGGSQVWANQSLFAQGTAVGCPPDLFNMKGQNWGLPPWKPQTMRSAGYEPYIQNVRANMRLAGSLRLDHALGFYRLFWIPEGMGAGDGCYLLYPLDELFGILALESHRNRCAIIGEDLGTVPDGFGDIMENWGLFSYKLFYFEKSDLGYKAPQHYLDRALVTLTTHDLPTLTGFWMARDIEVREDLHLYPNQALREQHNAERIEERWALLRALQEQNLMPEGTHHDP
jgi:4-alpha-glucanotransferase